MLPVVMKQNKFLSLLQINSEEKFEIHFINIFYYEAVDVLSSESCFEKTQFNY